MCAVIFAFAASSAQAARMPRVEVLVPSAVMTSAFTLTASVARSIAPVGIRRASARMPSHISPTRLRALVYRTHPCLAHIVDHENGLWIPTRSGAGGSYGLPQAQPGSKMASAGRDWRTNPWTQLRWMRGYVNARYGGECEAWAFWQRNWWY